MYVKIMESSPLGQKIVEMWKRGKEAMVECDRWARSQGADYCRGDYFCIFGGISTAHFNDKPPKGWVKAGPKHDKGEYLISDRTKEGKALLEQANALPRVTDKEFNELFKYDPRKMRTDNRISFHPSLEWGKNGTILLKFADFVEYKPVKYMEEITLTEYKSLQKPELKKKSK